MGAPVAALEHTVRGARGRAAQRAAAEHVAALEAASAARISAAQQRRAQQLTKQHHRMSMLMCLTLTDRIKIICCEFIACFWPGLRFNIELT